MSAQQSIRIAIIGAGIFARDAHLPAMQSLGDTFKVVAVCSRSQESAERLASVIAPDVEVYTDLDALLARPDIDAVDVVVPINQMPLIVEQCLRAGKHVISEKPIAPDVAAGTALLRVPTNAVWMVAENVRYTEAFRAAADAVQRGDIGTPIACSWARAVVLSTDNKYYNTQWRRAGDFPGGFLLDGGVHWMAALRMVMGEIARVSAFSRQVRDDLPPVDTLSAALEFSGGAVGAFTATFATGDAPASGMMVFGDAGSINVTNTSLTITRQGQSASFTFTDNGVRDEFAAFGASIRTGQPHDNSATEGLRDVAALEAMLRSAEEGRVIEVER